MMLIGFDQRCGKPDVVSLGHIPNDIFDLETRVVVHGPLGNSPTNGAVTSNHEVKGQSKAVVARLVSITVNCINFAREPGQDSLSSGNNMSLALVSRDGGASAFATLESCGAWAQVCSKFILRLDL